MNAVRGCAAAGRWYRPWQTCAPQPICGPRATSSRAGALTDVCRRVLQRDAHEARVQGADRVVEERLAGRVGPAQRRPGVEVDAHLAQRLDVALRVERRTLEAGVRDRARQQPQVAFG